RQGHRGRRPVPQGPGGQPQGRGTGQGAAARTPERRLTTGCAGPDLVRGAGVRARAVPDGSHAPWRKALTARRAAADLPVGNRWDPRRRRPMPTLAVDGADLTYDDEGPRDAGGAPLVFLHGW